MRSAINRLWWLEQRFAPEVDHSEILHRIVAEYEAARAAGANFADAERLAGAAVAEEFRSNAQAARFARSIAIGIRILEPESWFGPKPSDEEPRS